MQISHADFGPNESAVKAVSKVRQQSRADQLKVYENNLPDRHSQEKKRIARQPEWSWTVG